ncbi:DUF3299 domain-containing protein [Pseudomonas matsuisoli]|jgi:uncharacterized protein|uniref:DUF3299 domain-containing protein n=1 Tax=Pseudomonas matsuisoli TaxID=1515666 RepID=A0A917V1U3_9PSED|nr:DUF3299 domain-containing protein [Pseudomonas matsuisoli]GGK09738.1 hypothetical protein GCM10009304_39740 [Pseudomonas matsuisoli]
MLRALLCAVLMSVSTLVLADVRELQWEEMIPAGAPPAPEPIPLHELAGQLSEAGPAAAQSAPDAPVEKSLDGQQIKLPGYVVPLEISEEGFVKSFLFVPYYGACIHVPPPPSNQIVYVTSQTGIRLDALYQPFWIEGPMTVESTSSDLASAGYRMAADKIYPYELEN